MYRIELGDCLELMMGIPNGSIDLTVTSPPYDNLRTYENSIDWNFKIFTKIAKELFRVTKEGGVVVWVVGDATINGSESGNSFRQALFFKKIGFSLHDTMIWNKKSFSMPDVSRYHQVFEYMFIFKKGSRLNSFNSIQDRKNICGNQSLGKNTKRQVDGSFRDSNKKNYNQEFGRRFNIWELPTASQENPCANLEHPAMFSESLANDHILSWSNEGDTVLDPFLGSGTTAKMAIRNNRNFIGFEKVEKYFKIAEKRIQDEIDKTALFNFHKAS